MTQQTIQRVITDDLDALLQTLPPHICGPLKARREQSALLEVVLDLGRLPEARYAEEEVVLSDVEVTDEDIEYVVSRIGEFGDDNRAGIERTLHRISCIRNRRGRIVGLTLRVGRAVFGTIKIIEDLIQTGKSILLLGRPGVGKTTMLREVARVLADDLGKRVVIVDTSNEIAGDGDIPHPAIGRARRMQVATPTMQHAVMIEAVENHMPEVIVIDEIGTELEAAAARTIAERGVQLIGTAHGNNLENLMMNPTLSDLIGGIQSVTLGDEEARRRGTQKSILERKAPPTFDILVEIQSWDRVAIHHDVGETVDGLLRGYDAPAEIREIGEDGEIQVVHGPPQTAWWQRRPEPAPGRAERGTAAGRRQAPAYDGPERTAYPAAGPRVRVFPFGVSRNRLEQAMRQAGVQGTITDHLDQADAVMTLRNYYRRKPQILREAESRGIPVHVLKNNTIYQMEQSLLSMRGNTSPFDPVTAAMQEAEEAITHVINRGRPVELSPQNAYIRRLQHQMAQRYNVNSRSTGQEPFRRVRISPGRTGGGLYEGEE